MGGAGNCVLLNDRAVIRLQGEDMRPFLQGLITNDVQSLTSENALFSAILTPQGRFLADFFVVQDGLDILLDVPIEAAEMLMKKLVMYKLRSRVTISLTDLKVVAIWGDNARSPEVLNSLIRYRDARYAEMGWRIIIDNSALGEFPSFQAYEAYEQHRLSFGIPDGAKDAVAERSLLLELGYDRLGAISFSKGCYVGQEVTARSKYRGEMRKALFQVMAQDGDALPKSGTLICAGEEEVGEMRSSCGRIGLALLRIDRIESYEDFDVAEVPLTVTIPQWRA